MTLPGNGTTRAVVIGVAIILIAGLITQVIINSSRITALETKMFGLEKIMETNKTELNWNIQQNRIENNEAHKILMNKIDDLNNNLIKHMLQK